MSEVSPSPSSGSKVGLIVAIGGLIVAAWMIADHRERSRVTICKRSPEMAMAYDIESAVINFQTEYGRLPEGPERLATDSPEGIRLLEVLSGKETGAVRENSRSIKFLNVREETRGKGGIRHSNDSKRIMGVFDRWGKPLIVLLNRGDSDEFQFQHGQRTVHLKERKVAVFSAGEDRQIGSADDVTTW